MFFHTCNIFFFCLLPKKYFYFILFYYLTFLNLKFPFNIHLPKAKTMFTKETQHPIAVVYQCLTPDVMFPLKRSFLSYAATTSPRPPHSPCLQFKALDLYLFVSLNCAYLQPDLALSGYIEVNVDHLKSNGTSLLWLLMWRFSMSTLHLDLAKSILSPPL